MGKTETRIAIPSGVDVTVTDMTLTAKSKNRVVSKTFSAQGISFSVHGSEIIMASKDSSNKSVSRMNAIVSHIQNLFAGTQADFEYHMGIVFSHFPMTINVKESVVEINNFLGEKKSRKARILPGTKVTVKGKDIFVSGASKESVGQTAANIEGAARVVGRDKRVFQDGIFIVSKAKAGIQPVKA